jgi:hypothetical protein
VIGPRRFIPATARNGQSSMIDRWVIEARFAGWPRIRATAAALN